MIRAWIGVALLAVSWLLGLGYYYPPNYTAWTAAIIAGTLLLCGWMEWLPGRRDSLIVIALLVLVVFFAPWPMRAVPLLIAAGLVLNLLPIPCRWPKSVGRAAVAGGLVLLVQAAAMAIYTTATSRCHDLPEHLVRMLAGVARLLGIDAVADGPAVVMHSMRQVYRLAATWELLLDPPTLCFYVGSLVLFGLIARSRLPEGVRWKAWIGALRSLTIVVVVWLPIRAGVLIAMFCQRALCWDDVMPLHVMNQFWSPWVHLLLLLGPVLLAWRFVRMPSDEPDLIADSVADGKTDSVADGKTDSVAGGKAEGDAPATPGHRFALPRPPTEGQAVPDVDACTASAKQWHYPAGVGLVLLAAVVFTAAIHWDPIGRCKEGRVMVVERHSTWEPTTKPYDTKWFGHDSGYNYAALYDYLSKFFDMSQLLESDKIDDETLGRCDVLVIKTPTARYSKNEIDAVLRFVEQGGGLLLVGEHTNFEKSSSFMNDITRHLGFTFRHDLLFGIDKPYEQLYVPPRVPHPIVQHLPPMDFAVSCSIDPGRSRGRAAMLGTGLWSLMPNYHTDNYFPVPHHHPDMRYGAFVQLWSMRFGKGRVLAFTDSTIFSNFCTFQPGKAELMLGMVEWLNRRRGVFDPRGALLVLGLIPMATGLWLVRSRKDTWLLLIAAVMCGCAIGGMATAAVHRWAMPPLQPVRPMVRVVIDRTTSAAPLSKGAYIEDEQDGTSFGLLEQCISRLGYFTTRCSGPDAFRGDVLVVICPSKSVSRRFRERLIEYVEDGGKLLVIDSPDNEGSTADSLLWPFKLSVLRNQEWQGQLSIGKDWPLVPVESAYEVAGGKPIAQLGTRPVAAVSTYGKGTAMVVGFGPLFNDANMGFAWTAEPDADMLPRYDVLFALVRSLVTGEPVGPPPPRKPPPPQPETPAET